MQIMLAEDIGGWLVAGAIMLGSLVSSLLALGALYTAYHGKGTLTVCLLAPAVVMAILAVWYFADAYIHREFHDREEIMSNYIQPWLVMGFPPLATSLLAGGLLVWRKRGRFSDN